MRNAAKSATADVSILTKLTHWLLKKGFSEVNTGSPPKSNARQVIPKANAGLPGRILLIAVKVTGIVI